METPTINLNDHMFPAESALTPLLDGTPIYDGLVADLVYDPTVYYGDLFSASIIASITPLDLAARLERLHSAVPA
jgi:hypothetical protein